MVPLSEGGFPEPKFDCGWGDFGCYTNENIFSVMIGAITGMGDFTADIIVNAFDKPISNDEWGVAFGQWGMWAAAMLIFVGIVMMYQMGVGLIMQNRRRIGSAVVGGILALPFAAAAVMLMARVVEAIDEGSQKVVESIQGGKVGDAVIATMGLSGATGQFDDTSIIHTEVSDAVTAQSIAGLIPAGFLLILMMIGGALLDMAMSFRKDGLLILAAIAPIALMMIGQGKLGAWTEKWLALVTGLLLMKPLVIGILSVTIALSGQASGRTFSDLLVSVLIVFACAFAPFWVVKLVDITGGEIGAAMAHRPSIRSGGSRMNSVVNNRVVQGASRGVRNAGAAVGRGMKSALSILRRK